MWARPNTTTTVAVATNAELHDEVRALRVAVLDLAEAVSSKAETVDVVPREELNWRLRRSGQRTVAAIAVVLLLALSTVLINRVTLQQAQDQAAQDLATLIQTCRTTAPVLPPKDMAYCQQRIPGFVKARENVARTAATTQRNERRLRHLEDEVAALKE